MDASKRRYTEIIGNAVQFVIPVFQRDYSWMQEQCEQLWDDIERTSQMDGDDEHFFGAVVYISTVGQSAAFTRWLLIDGQQRMTTVSLLAAAMRDHIRDLPPSEALKGKANKIEHDFLINTFESDDRQHKLVLRARDEAILRAIVSGDGAIDGSATVTKNYEFFRAKLQDADIDAILAGVGRLAVVDVRLDRGEDDPQQIFESLNSTGVDLTQADLVRNYVLMGLGQQSQESLYRRYWQKIEYLCPGRKLDNFLGDFVALQTRAQGQVPARHVYRSFCAAFGDRKNDESRIEDLLKCMLKFARYHAAFVTGTGEFPAVSDRLSGLKDQTTTPAILVMRLLDAFERKHITEEDLVGALELVESYVVRRSVCGKRSQSYWMYFSRLAYALREADVLGYLKVNLYWLSGNYAFPTDEQFKRALEQDNLYNRRICPPLLTELENGRSKERSDTTSLTIEHIMPQNRRLSTTWQKMLGDNWEHIQAEWLHRLGNLTFTAYNEKLSDRPFHYKKTCKDGFKDSSLRLNKYVAKQKKWTETQMRKRGKKLANVALDLWPSLNVSRELLREVTVSKLRDEGNDVEVTRKGMDDGASVLFDAFRSQMPLDDIIEVPRPKSVSYHNNDAMFFCEVLPRSRYLLLLLSVDVDECAKCDLDVRDTAEQNFIVNARNSGGCYLHVYTDDDVGACMPLVLGALAASTD